MTSTTEIGTELEELVAGLFGSRRQPGSGSTPWAKMDVRGQTLLWSCKAGRRGDTATISVREDEFAEVERAARGPGGTGDVPAFAVEHKGRVFALMDLSDLASLLASDVTISRPRADERRQRVSVPAALRR